MYVAEKLDRDVSNDDKESWLVMRVSPRINKN